MKRFSQFRQREGNRFKQRLVPFFNGVYGIYAKLRRAVGNPIVISDASDEALFGLKVFGKSTQNGTPTPDAPVEIVSVENPTVKVDAQNLSVPYTLHGVPVTSGGNYIDVNGQQWICDEVNFERGVYVQRVYKYTITGNENWILHDSGRFYSNIGDVLKLRFISQCCICSIATLSRTANNGYFCTNGTSGVYLNRNDKFNNVDSVKNFLQENNSIIIIALQTPIETPLTADQIEVYKALHTNKPNTTILNDQNAWMEVMYTSK